MLNSKHAQMCPVCAACSSGFPIRPRSQYCSVACGVKNATEKLRSSKDKALDDLINGLRKGSPSLSSASDRDDIIELDAAQSDILQIANAIKLIQEEAAGLEKHVQHINEKQVTPDEKETRKVVHIDCPTCGNLQPSNDFIGHVESCYQRINTQLGKSEVKRRTSKALPLISPKTKVKDAGFAARTICGCPLDGSNDGSNNGSFCRQQHCEKHGGWEEIIRGRLIAKEQQLHASQERFTSREARIKLRLSRRHVSGSV